MEPHGNDVAQEDVCYVRVPSAPTLQACSPTGTGWDLEEFRLFVDYLLGQLLGSSRQCTKLVVLFLLVGDSLLGLLELHLRLPDPGHVHGACLLFALVASSCSSCSWLLLLEALPGAASSYVARIPI